MKLFLLLASVEGLSSWVLRTCIHRPFPILHYMNRDSDANEENKNTPMIISIQNFSSIPVIDEAEMRYKTDALAILDFLTSAKNEDDPAYDVEKDVQRDELLINTDYTDLKVELRARGLRTSGDKLEMMIRLLLHIIDPSINFNELSGREASLKYVDKDDLDTAKIRIVPESERAAADAGPDAEDLSVLRKSFVTSPSNTVGGSLATNVIKPEKPKIVMDGLTRREIDYGSLYITRDAATSKLQDSTETIRAYVVGGRDVLRTWEKISPVVIVFPDEHGWRNKQMRIFADEIAFYNQAIVMVPDIHRSRAYLAKQPEHSTSLVHEVFPSEEQVFDDVVSTIRFAQMEYSSKAICFAGIGYGGGRALTVAAQLAQFVDPDTRAYTESLVRQAYEERKLVLEPAPILEGITEDFVESPDTAATEEQIEPIVASRSTQVPRKVNNKATRPDAIAPVRVELISNCSVSHRTLSESIPCGVFVASPSGYDVKAVSDSIVSPLFAVFGDGDVAKGSTVEDAEYMHDTLVGREAEVKDFSFRVYEGRSGAFLHRPVSDEDRLCAQEALALGAIWLDVFSRQQEDDPTEGTGDTKREESFRIIQMKDLLTTPLRTTTVATYLHDGEDVFNSRLRDATGPIPPTDFT